MKQEQSRSAISSSVLLKISFTAYTPAVESKTAKRVR